MEAREKKVLKALSLTLRHLLEGQYDSNGEWHAGDLEQRLNSIGVWRDRTIPADEMRLLPDDAHARQVVDAYLKLRDEAGVDLSEAVAEFVRETAYTWANRLFALRCMESRELIDEVVLQKDVYGGRSLEHHRLVQHQPEIAVQEDDGLFAVFDAAFTRTAGNLPILFDPKSPGVALKPSVAGLKRCIALLSGTEPVNGQGLADDSVFSAPDALGWAYQYWNTEEKDRVFETVRTKKGAKIEGADIIPATQLYTEDYMVKFLVQNSLGATWVGMKRDTRLVEDWEYFVRDADRTPVEKKSVREITFLDPACGSGHFLIEAFDLFYGMYKEEGEISDDEEICRSILTNNLFGIDIDQRAVEISEAALWMKAAERSFGFSGRSTNLVATNIRLPRGRDHLREFLDRYPEDRPLAPAIEAVFQALQHADELGSLLQLEEPVDRELKLIKQRQDEQSTIPRSQVLFEEIRQPVQTQLPVDVEDWDTWKSRTVQRIREHFEKQAQAANLREQFFGVEAEKGWRLFESLAGKYDVVAANPPYMGSKNMGPTLKSFVEVYYSAARRDLYAAFILRCLDLSRVSGRTAMVTQQTWLFQTSFVDMRISANKDTGSPSGILSKDSFELLAHLGPGAFEEIGGEVVNTAMFVIARHSPTEAHRVTAFKLTGTGSLQEKKALLRQCIAGRGCEARFTPAQADFVRIPQSPVVYYLPEEIIQLLVTSRTLADIAYVRQGMATGDNSRFTRCFWEIPDGPRWRPYAKGGGYMKWCGLDWLNVDWQCDAIVLRSSPRARFQASEFYFTPGLTYSPISGGALGTRQLENSVFDVKGASIFAKPDAPPRTTIAAHLNTHIGSYLSRAVSHGIELHVGYLANLPIPARWSTEATRAGDEAVRLKRFLVGSVPVERAFARSLSSLEQLQVAASLHTVEGLIESETHAAYGLSDDATAVVTFETGAPAGWFRLVAGYDRPVILPEVAINPRSTDDYLSGRPREQVSPVDLDCLRSRLRSLYETGPGIRESDEDLGDAVVEEEEEDAVVGMRIPVPAETFLEDLAQKLEIHPVSVYWLLREGMEEAGWRCLPEERRTTSDRLSVIVLRLLGHRWPKQIQAGEAVPEWADVDGVIPLTGSASEPTLQSRTRDRLASEFQDSNAERETEELMGKTLDQWLVSDFFKVHISQFKKRPIAWQLQVGKFSGRKAPAFSCMVYYHKLSESFLPTIQSQYIRPLRQGLETEQRGIEGIPLQSRNEVQIGRLRELADLIEELSDFDGRLASIATNGFATPGLKQFAVNDAMLALKARWLRRLSEVVSSGPLTGWQTAAEQTGLHEDFKQWVTDAVTRLGYSCARVGPAAPSVQSLATDPTSQDLARLICPRSKAMVSDSIELACDSWWKTFDEVVLRPIKARIKVLNEEHKTLDAEHKVLTGKADPDAAQATDSGQMTPEDRAERIRRLERRMKQIKQEIKPLRAEQSDKTDKAKALRRTIEKWTCPEADTWESWLASQPLYDQVSALDGQRQPPSTVEDFVRQESLYAPDINDGVRVNIAPIQKAGLLAADVLAGKDIDKAIADRAEWRSDERRWVREGKLPQPGWWE